MPSREGLLGEVRDAWISGGGRGRAGATVVALLASALLAAGPGVARAQSQSGSDQVSSGSSVVEPGHQPRLPRAQAKTAGEVGDRLHDSAKGFGEALLGGIKYAGRTGRQLLQRRQRQVQEVASSPGGAERRRGDTGMRPRHALRDARDAARRRRASRTPGPSAHRHRERPAAATAARARRPRRDRSPDGLAAARRLARAGAGSGRRAARPRAGLPRAGGDHDEAHAVRAELVDRARSAVRPPGESGRGRRSGSRSRGPRPPPTLPSSGPSAWRGSAAR